MVYEYLSEHVHLVCKNRVIIAGSATSHSVFGYSSTIVLGEQSVFCAGESLIGLVWHNTPTRLSTTCGS